MWKYNIVFQVNSNRWKRGTIEHIDDQIVLYAKNQLTKAFFGYIAYALVPGKEAMRFTPEDIAYYEIKKESVVARLIVTLKNGEFCTINMNSDVKKYILPIIEKGAKTKAQKNADEPTAATPQLSDNVTLPTSPSVSEQGKAVVQSLAEQHEGKRFPIGSDAVLIGRDECCQLSYREGTPGISRKHCVLTWDDDQRVFILMDLDSTYGTYLEDGTKLVPRTPYRLQPGARFYLAGKENMILVDLDRPKSEAAGRIPMGSGETSLHNQNADRKKTGGAARVIGWILIIFQIIALWGASQTGGLQLGLFEALGYFLPGILGIILICVGDRRKRKADQQSENR